MLIKLKKVRYTIKFYQDSSSLSILGVKKDVSGFL